MNSNSSRESLYGQIIEPVVAIDVKTKRLIFCNKACHALWNIEEGMSISEFCNHISTDINYELLRVELIERQKECYLQEVKLYTLAQGTISGNLRAGFINHDKNQVYFFFQYNRRDVENIVLKNRCYDAIYSRSYSYPFRLDIKHKTIYFIGPILEQFNLSPVIYNYPQVILDADILVEDDRDNFINMVSDMYRGEPTTYAFRTYTADGLLLWYQPQYTVTRNEEGEPVELLGEFVNIQEKKEMESRLNTDDLTKCLNKAAFQTFTANTLLKRKPEEQHALFIIDIDNFKMINDNLGHLFGDAVLREAGTKLNNIFRDSDYVGRIGGDEFMVLVHNIESDDMLKQCAGRILKAFDKVYKGHIKEYRTTASIGIAVSPQNGEDFTTLYKCADLALYHTKHKGKNGYTYYNETMIDGNMGNTTPFDVANRALSQHFDQELIINMFALLSEAKDYDASINKALELLALRFKVSRSYIFEYTKDNSQYMDNTYEWCASGVTPEIDNLHMIPQSVYGPFIDEMNENGIYYCNDLETLKETSCYDVMNEQGIQSFLFAFNMKEDTVTSMVGFDDCERNRIWSPIEIGTLMHASKIINQFLRYKHAVQSVECAMSEKFSKAENPI